MDVDTGRLLFTVASPEEDAASTFGLSPNGKELVVAGGRSMLLHRFDLTAALHEARALLAKEGEDLEKVLEVAPGASARSASVGDDAKDSTPVLQVAEDPGSAPQLTEAAARWKGHSMPMLDLAWDSTGSMVATASADRSVRVWNTRRNHLTHQFQGHSHIVLRTAFHPNPQRLMLASSGEDGEVRLWDLQQNKCIAALKNHMSGVPALCFLPGSDLLVSGGRDKMICIWDTRAPKLIKAAPLFSSVTWVCPVPATAVPGAKAGQHYLAAATETGECHVLEASTLRPMLRFVLPNAALQGQLAQQQQQDEAALVISHVLCRQATWGQGSQAVSEVQLLLSSAEANIHVLDLATGHQLKTLMGHNDEVLAAEMLPGGTLALFANNSPHLRLMDLDTFDCELLSGHSGIVMSVSVSDDGWVAP